MKNAWKWILGILLLLVIVAVVVAVPFVMHSYMLARYNANLTTALPQQQQPQLPSPGQNGNGNNMVPRNGARPGLGRGYFGRGVPMGPMMRGRGFGFNRGFGLFGFGILGGFLRLVPWLILALLLWGAYWLGRRSGRGDRQTPAAPPVAPAQPAVISSDNPQDPVI